MEGRSSISVFLTEYFSLGVVDFQKSPSLHCLRSVVMRFCTFPIMGWSLFPSLESALVCDLLWPIKYGRYDTVRGSALVVPGTQPWDCHAVRRPKPAMQRSHGWEPQSPRAPAEAELSLVPSHMSKSSDTAQSTYRLIRISWSCLMPLGLGLYFLCNNR